MSAVESNAQIVGTSVRRRQDTRLLTGKGAYVADIQRPNVAHMAVLRSRHAHARISRLDVAAVKKIPGVLDVITGADIAGRVKPLPVLREGRRLKSRDYPVLPIDKAIYVGQPIAAVVADTRYLAEDALEAIDVDYEPLPVVIDAEAAMRPGAPLIHEAWGDNIANALIHTPAGVEEALWSSDVVLTRKFRIGRCTALPLEGRGVVAEYDETSERLTLWYASQAPHLFRTYLADMIGFPENRIHVITRDVGGGFGLKVHYYPEEVLAALLTLRLKRPVRWIEDRLESFLGSVHAREQVIELTVGARKDGRLTAIKAKIIGDVGAHLHTKGSGPIGVTAENLVGCYDVTAYAVEAYSVVTNKVPFGSYRGFGAPQAYIALEGMLDLLAHALGLDPAEIRLRNLLRPDQLPHRMPLGSVLDSGDYPACVRRLLVLSKYAELRTEQARRRQSGGKLMGIGICVPFQMGGYGSCQEMRERAGIINGGYESAVVRVEPTGRVTVASGLVEMGQGINTALAQICAQELGVDVDNVDVVMGDTDLTPYSAYGTAANRGAVVGGIATLHAARLVREKILRLGAHRLEAHVDDLEILNGTVMVKGVPAMGLPLAVLARDAYMGQNLPTGMEPGLEARYLYDQQRASWSYAAYLAVVEVDPETWTIAPREIFVVHDCGTPINPRLIEGQIRGGSIQGLGEALYEQLVYDENGQLLVGTLMDYLLPTVHEVVPITIEHMVTPSPFSANGAKAAGDGGVVGVPAALICAVADAVRRLGMELTQCPVTPEVLSELADRASPNRGEQG